MSDADALLPAAMARRAEEVGAAKVALALPKMFVLSVLAGAFIALGAVLSTVATTSHRSGSVGGAAPALHFGVSRLLGGLTFSLGLVLVVIAGAELFTGNTLVVMAWARALVGNMIGGAVLVGLVYWFVYLRGEKVA